MPKHEQDKLTGDKSKRTRAISSQSISKQHQTIINEMLKGGVLSVRQAILELKINGLTARICELRKFGFLIASKFVGEQGARYNIYFIEPNHRQHNKQLLQSRLQKQGKTKGN